MLKYVLLLAKPKKFLFFKSNIFHFKVAPQSPRFFFFFLFDSPALAKIGRANCNFVRKMFQVCNIYCMPITKTAPGDQLIGVVSF